MSFIANALNNVPVTNVNTVVFTSNGTYTPPSNLRTAVFFLQGAGGGAGGASNPGSNQGSFGNSGGSGAWGQITRQASSIAGPVTVTVGLGGAGGSGSTPTNGAQGGVTTITDGVDTWTVGGGSGGSTNNVVADGGYYVNVAVGPSSNSGSFDFTGSQVQLPGLFINRVSGSRRSLLIGSTAGCFGGTIGGVSNATGGAATDGVNGTFPGNGGRGANIRNPAGASSRAGGDGADGVVIVYEFLADAP